MEVGVNTDLVRGRGVNTDLVGWGFNTDLVRGRGLRLTLWGVGGVLTLTWYWLFLEVVMEAVTGEQVEAHP